MQNNSDLDFLTKAFEVKNALNGFIKRPTSLYNIIMTNWVIRIDRNTNHAIRVSDFTESSRKSLIFESSAITKHVDGGVRQLYFRVFDKGN